jgi:Flp pilus assembly protein TadD
MILAMPRALAAGALALAALFLVTPAGAVEDEVDTALEARDPDYAAGRRALESKQWEEAAQRFARVALRESGNADIHNLLGFSYRQTGKLDLALDHYRRALAIDPRHKGAHEYIGETYLKLGDVAAAERHLATLRNLCPLSCEQLKDLEREVAAYKAEQKGKRP